MNLKWGIFAQCINEKELIEAKIEWALRQDMAISICEGHYPNYKDFNPETHLSKDKTTEILKSYSDRINYIPAGEVAWQGVLRDKAYKGLPNDLDVVIMSDIDEFWLEEDLERIDELYTNNKDLKDTMFNSFIFLDEEYCCPHVMFTADQMIPFSKKFSYIAYGDWHERIFRYNKFYGYKKTPFLVNDLYGRDLFSHPVYYNERDVIPDIYMLHYKNFKMEEAKRRHEMYKERGDKADYNLEWDILEKNKFKYKGQHPIEIQRLMK